MNETQFGKGATDKPEDYFGPKAWRHEEIAGAPAPATWVEKSLYTGFISYPKKNQAGSFSCVIQALAKQLAVDELQENGAYRELGPRSIYPYVYLPDGGSSSITATTWAKNHGMTLESLLPGDKYNEQAMRSDQGYLKDAKLIATIYKPDSFVECNADFETIASILQGFRNQGIKKVITTSLIGQDNGSWFSTMPVPPKNPSNLSPWYHRVSITDFGLIGGKKVLAFDNSWGEGPGNKGQQFLTQDYAPFLYGGIYTLNRPDDFQQQGLQIQPPTYTWNVDLAFGSAGPDVTALQQALQSLGMFPISSVVKPTGMFFGVTQKGVQLFQAAFGLPITGIVDAITRAKLNNIF